MISSLPLGNTGAYLRTKSMTAANLAQIQFICGIIISRIGLLMVNKRRITIIRWSVGSVLGLINISVFFIWITARLQISPTCVHMNDILDLTEKGLVSIIDSGLNAYFIYLLRSRLLASSKGLNKYTGRFYFNCFTIAISVGLDVGKPVYLVMES